MKNKLKLTAKSELPMILVFSILTFILWSLVLVWLFSGNFFEYPSPIAFLFGCATAFFARMFYRNGQAYALLDPTGDGQAETEAGMIFRKKVYICNGLRDVKAVHVYHRIVTSTASYYPCLQFNDGFELWLPEGQQSTEQVVKWFKEQLGMELQVFTHKGADTKDIMQKEKAGRCYPKE